MTLQAIDHVLIAMPPGGEPLARSFYAGLLGLSETPKPQPLAARGGLWFHGAGTEIHLGVEENFRPSAKAHVAFIVDDVVDIAARAREAGYRVDEERALAHVERVNIYDPFGNRLEFMRRLDGHAAP